MNIWFLAIGFLTRVTPINPAEAVFAPFWDNSLNEYRQWQCTAGKISPSFGCARYNWSSRPSDSGKPAFEAVRNSPFSCRGYDTFIYAGAVPQQARLRIILETDKGPQTGEWVGKSPYRDEYQLPLNGVEKISKITFQIFDTGKNKVKSGNLLWMGLQNTAELKRILEQQRHFASQPLDVFLAPPDTQPSFRGKSNLLIPAAELTKIQAAYQQQKKKLEKAFSPIPALQPETQYTGVLPYANVKMFGRIRDEKQKLFDVRWLITKALITTNRQMLEKAVRTALVIALTPNWDSTFFSVFQDTGWDQRVFGNAAAAEVVALALDYGSDLLSPAGRSLLAKRLAVEGLGQINYNIWKYKYLFGNNQLSAFSRGRIAAYLVLEKTYPWNGPRVKPYTELAMRELFDSIEILVHEDGSFLEGPGYFCYTIGSIQPVLEMYASARNRPLPEIIPPKLKNLGKFADAFISTDRRGGVIPVSSGQGNARNAFRIGLCQFLAILAPESQWVTMYQNLAGNQEQLWVPDLSLISRHSQVSRKPVKMKPLAVLPTMGIMASTRFFEGEPVKILLVGTKAKTTCHRHNDRGSFVLEFAGDTYAADPGGQSYEDNDGGMVKRSDYHNMLVPGDMPANEPMMVARANVYPAGTGDEKSFQAEILPAPSSYNYFTEWKRTIKSPVPDQFLFRDDYRLTPGRKSARFLWITELPWKKIKDGVIRLDGKNSYALIHYPKDLKFYSDTLIVRRKEVFHRLNFEKDAPNGTIEIQVDFHRKTGTK